MKNRLILLAIFFMSQTASARHVVIIGGGVAGLSAAQELILRGYQVTIFEKADSPGGRARSISIAGSGTEGRLDLPAEHGNRAFFGFYWNLVDTMSRIPTEINGIPATMKERLVVLHELHIAKDGHEPIYFPTQFPPRNFPDFLRWIQAGVHFSNLVPPLEIAHFAKQLFIVLTSSDQRLNEELDNISWWDFIGAATRSEAYQREMGELIPTTGAGLKAKNGSARAIGMGILQLIYSGLGLTQPFDRVLNGPTNEVWIQPWLNYLQSLGVEYRSNHEVTAFILEGRTVTGVQVLGGDKVEIIHADAVISTLPVEKLRQLVTLEMRRADPGLQKLDRLQIENYNGVQIYLERPIFRSRGHIVFDSAPWKLNGIIQSSRIWERPLTQYGDGTVSQILSIDIGSWNAKGLNGKTVGECTRLELVQEIVAQITRDLRPQNPNVEHELRQNLVTVAVDAEIDFSDGTARNMAPLHADVVGSYFARPEPRTGIDGFFLAGDFVNPRSVPGAAGTISSMEGANISARVAVNEILRDFRDGGQKVPVFENYRPGGIFAAMRTLDAQRFREGKPHLLSCAWWLF